MQYGDVNVGESGSSNKIQDSHPITTRRHTVGPGNGLTTQVTIFYFLLFNQKIRSLVFYSFFI